MTDSKTRFVVKVAMLTAVAFVLQILGSALPFKVGGFLDIEISDYPAIIAALAMGPLAGILVEFLKNFLHCIITHTGFIGELANFIINGSFVLIAGLVYKMGKTKKQAIIGLILATVVYAIVGIFANLFLLLPLYMPDADINTKLNIILTTITPFNLVKGAVLSAIIFMTYKMLSPILHK